MKKTLSILLIVCLMLTACVPAISKESPVMAADEMRGVWVPTVFSLNFPAKTSTDPQTLKNDIDNILNKAKAMGYNAVFFQARPSADSFYDSDIFPWSKYLTGKQGTAPKNGFDPLEYIVEQSHQRGLELHAWINPYRVTASSGDTLASSHPAKVNSSWTIKHEGKLYWNPGLPQVQTLIANGAKEIVQNYDVDGIHIDDYFYPSESEERFNDSAAYSKYGSGSSLANWRRSNTETTVRNFKKVAEDAGVVFGVSPFGIWANKSSSSYGSNTSGKQSYFEIYADTRKWVKSELIDYIAPQIYWAFDFSIARYDVLVDWWCDVVKGTNVDLYIGLAAYRYAPDESTRWTNLNEMKRQIEYLRKKTDADGYIMYSYKVFTQVKGLRTLVADMNGMIFPDSVWHWAYKVIVELAEKDIVKGSTNGYFYPDNNIKRADYVLMLLRLLGIDSETGLENFSDVASGKYYANAIATAKKYNLIDGVGNNKFAPEKQISRQDLFKMTYSALIEEGLISPANDNSSLNKFKDKSKISNYALLSMSSLTENGLIKGSDGYANPKGKAKRSETAQVIFNLTEKYGL